MNSDRRSVGKARPGCNHGRAAPRRAGVLAATQHDWLGELAGPAWQFLSSGRRLAQEHIGWEILRTQKHE